MQMRPMTAAVGGRTQNRPIALRTGGSTLLTKKKGAKPKKTDPVSRYQNLQNDWKKNNLIKNGATKQGRKLELERFNKWSQACKAYNDHCTIKKGSTVQQRQQNNQQVKAPTDNRRDDLRFQLRAKISQQDYVDRSLKNFHYKEEIVSHKTAEQSEKQKLEALKKQIYQMKKAMKI